MCITHVTGEVPTQLQELLTIIVTFMNTKKYVITRTDTEYVI